MFGGGGGLAKTVRFSIRKEASKSNVGILSNCTSVYNLKVELSFLGNPVLPLASDPIRV